MIEAAGTPRASTRASQPGNKPSAATTIGSREYDSNRLLNSVKVLTSAPASSHPLSHPALGNASANVGNAPSVQAAGSGATRSPPRTGPAYMATIRASAANKAIG